MRVKLFTSINRTIRGKLVIRKTAGKKRKANDDTADPTSTFEVRSRGSDTPSIVTIVHRTEQDRPQSIESATAKYQTLIHELAQVSRSLGHSGQQLLGDIQTQLNCKCYVFIEAVICNGIKRVRVFVY